MRRIAAWIACCAILMAALMPAISPAAHAAPAFFSSGAAWMKICCASGARLIRVDASVDGKNRHRPPSKWSNVAWPIKTRSAPGKATAQSGVITADQVDQFLARN